MVRRRAGLSRGIRRRLNKRKRLFQLIQQMPDGVEKDIMECEYEIEKLEEKKCLKEEERRERIKGMAKAAINMSCNPNAPWSHLQEMGNWKGLAGSSGVPVVRDKEGRLLTDPEEIGKAWSDHYEALAEDQFGRSQDPEYWKGKVDDWDLPHLDCLDKDFSMEELLEAASHLRDHKAPGEDGIVGEWMKALMHIEKTPGQEGGGEPSLMAQVILRLYNAIWKQGYIPSSWRRATVISIHKKGDPTDMDNYRGISLMPVPLKLLLVILTYRLVRALEKKGLLAREQAGFREHEECSGQVAALVETIMRRSGVGQVTYAMFVDLTKAYDMVPHEALFAKMHQIGIRGRMLGFIMTLYYQSEIVVGMGGEQKPFRLKRGLRQGCPMSCILFDIFINDLYGRPGVKREHVGVTVPGVDIEKEGLLAGLLFADDLVGFAESIERMREHALLVDEWCKRWDMRVGIKKCGVMCLGVGKKTQTLADEGQMSLVMGGPPCLGGEPVPIVEEYVYLGVTITRSLDKKVMLERRLKKATAAAFFIRPLLRDKFIPMGIRSLILQSVVMSSLLYGSEIWGMDAKLCDMGQTELNKVMRPMLGCKAKATNVPVAAMWRELGVPPVRAAAAARRARAWFKYPSLKTWIGVLCKYERPKGVKAWVSSTRSWLSGHKLLEADGGDRADSPEESTYKRVLQAEWVAAERTNKAKGALKYLGSDYASLSSLVAIPPLGRREQVKLGPGLRMVSLCRLGSFWTGASLAQAYKKQYPDLDLYEELCPCCEGWVWGSGEDINHMLVDCIKWEKEREKYLGRLIRQLQASHGPLGSDQLGVLLLGGASEGRRIRDWLPPRKGASLSRLSREEITQCGALEVARFVQSIDRERREIVRDLASRDLPSLSSLVSRAEAH